MIGGRILKGGQGMSKFLQALYINNSTLVQLHALHDQPSVSHAEGICM